MLYTSNVYRDSWEVSEDTAQLNAYVEIEQSKAQGIPSVLIPDLRVINTKDKNAFQFQNLNIQIQEIKMQEIHASQSKTCVI